MPLAPRRRSVGWILCVATTLVTAFGAAGSAAAADAVLMRAVLANTDTSIVVEAGAHAPRLTELRLRGALTWHNEAAESLPRHLVATIASASAGVSVGPALVWHFDRAASRATAAHIRLVYTSTRPRLELVSSWRVRAPFGPIEHTVRIRNRGARTVWLPLQPSLTFDWRIDPHEALQRFWVEKGADAPSDQGTHLDPLGDGDHWQGTSSTYARPIAGEPREMIPFVLVDEPGGARRGWFVGIEFSGRTRITLARAGAALRGEAGLNPAPGPYRTRLPPGGTFVTPTIFLGAFRGGPDGAGNLLRRWVRVVLQDPRTLADPSYPLLVDDSWGAGMAVDASLAHRMILDAAQLGLEMFHLDAGWFRGVGDWRADPVKFPHGIASVADFAHRHGLKFGLWVDWTQAGTSTAPGALNVFDPATRDWLVADPPAGWRDTEPFKGITIDLGVPAAATWAARELEHIVTHYHLDMLEQDGYLVAQGSARTDHPAAPPDPGTLRIYQDSGFLWADGSNSTDVSDYATRAYYRIYDRLRAHHPGLLLEICNDGGRMVDFGSAAHGDYFSITDTYDPLANRRAFYDASYVLPPAMLGSYVARWPTPRIENFRYMLRSGMLGAFSLMQDTSRWTSRERADARAEFRLYRTRLRPLIREADLYHVSRRPDGVHWDGIEYYSPRDRRGVLYAFRGAAPNEPLHRFRLKGLRADRRYELRFHDRGSAAMRIVSGRALMRQGVQVSLPWSLSSELVFFHELR